MILIGLTGGIACGKSTVSSLLQEEYGITVLDADQIVRELQAPHTLCTRIIAWHWPQCIEAQSGHINRAALGEIVFADRAARRRLTLIMHPFIFWTLYKRIMQAWLAESWLGRYLTSSSSTCNRAHIIVLDAPTLYETGLLPYVIDGVVVVACDEERQLARLLRRSGLTREAALRRIRAQMPLQEKRRRAGYVIENDMEDAEDAKRALRPLVAQSVAWMSTQRGTHATWLVCLSAVASAAVVAPALYLGARLTRALFSA